jgi:hypothetical protein
MRIFVVLIATAVQDLSEYPHGTASSVLRISSAVHQMIRALTRLGF